MLLLPDIRATYYIRDPDSYAAHIPDPTTHTTPKPLHKQTSRTSKRTAIRGASTPASANPQPTARDAHDLANSRTSPSSEPHSRADASLSLADLQNTRDTLTSLLAALATLDFSAFLHSFNTRIHNSSGQDPNTPSHTAALNAMLALLRTHSGCDIVLRHVTVLADSALRLLDPKNTTRRSQTLNAVAALMNQLCVRLPMVAAHNTTSAFAVAVPEVRVPDARSALTALQAPVSIFNMSTGIKTHVLVLSRSSSSSRAPSSYPDINPLLPMLEVRDGQSGTGMMCGICAIAFRKDGMALAAYSRLVSYIYIWTLQPAWVTRMSAPAPPRNALQSLLSAAAPPNASPLQLEPYRVMAAPPAEPPPPRLGTLGSSDLSFSLSWAPDGSSIELKHAGRALGSMPVQCP